MKVVEFKSIISNKGRCVEVHGYCPANGHIATIKSDRVVEYHKRIISDLQQDAINSYSLWANPDNIFDREVPAMYIITGKDSSGKSFKPIWTATPQHYNIWSGTLWVYVNGVRKRVKIY